MKDGPMKIIDITRRDAAALCAGLGASLAVPAALAQPAGLLARRIPHGNGETLPAVGVGTVNVFDVGPEELAGPTAVVRALIAGGGKLIDTAPSYNRAEAVVGAVLAATGLRPRAFIATKLERYRPGQLLAETRECLARLKTEKIDALQLHNVRDPNQSLAELNALKAQGLIRYNGITTTFGGAYAACEAIVRREKPDFVEVDYAIDNRDVEERILPACAEAGSAVLCALPFGRGALFRKALGKPLPDWAAEFDCKSWAQFFLKYLLANPAVTAVIPGTSNPAHMTDNLGAARGRLPDAAMRARMIAHVQAL
jgi:aryl-alcohol dehydrogenase-like predicted oxidoreductase